MPTACQAHSHHHWLQIGADGRTWAHAVLTWLREVVCGLSGHDLMLHFAPRRMWLECSLCGHRTPGWHLSPARGTRSVR